MKQFRIWIQVMFLAAILLVVSSQSAEAQWQEEECVELFGV